ncbi:MAG: flagellar hook-associated protein FlgK, partial [Clostridiaceae bacterium]
MSGLFATFNIGKRGLFAQQKSIDVTSHNIANANTEGYSRQRATLETTRPFGMPSMNNQVGPGQVGTGVDVSCIQRIRDGFMDYQVRREKSTLGQYEARDKYLSEIESIFNEPSDNGLSNLIGKFFNAWDQLSKQPESSNARTVAAQQSAALADELNHTYNQLMSVKSNAQESIKQSIFDLNGMLDRLDKLNQQIMSVKVSGMEPNDLMDQRDLLLDQLSEKFNIN